MSNDNTVGIILGLAIGSIIFVVCFQVFFFLPEHNAFCQSLGYEEYDLDFSDRSCCIKIVDGKLETYYYSDEEFDMWKEMNIG